MTERYDAYGRLLTETDRSGQATSYNYNSISQLDRIIDAFGHSITLGYYVGGNVATVTTPDGRIINYSYDTNGNLACVAYPDSTVKLYHYEKTAQLHHLTGISYANGNCSNPTDVARYATYDYDTNGKAIRTEHAETDNGSAQERFTLNYDSATQTTVTDAIGTQEVMSFATNLGVKNLALKTNQSDGKSVQQLFDGNNNLTCRKDEENRITLYSYNATNQKTSMTEGLAGSDCNTCLANPTSCNTGGVARTTTYEYLSPTLDLPRFLRRPSVAPGQTFETELIYGDAGHPNLPTQIIQRGYTPTGTSVSRTVTLGYNASGQVNAINGPRTDVSDTTTLEYYECTTGGACGQLKQVTNALGHVTTYDSYDAAGRLLQATEPNGLKTAYTYDPRGRVMTVTQAPAAAPNTLCTTAGNACWQYRYTPWGEVSQVTDPDGVALDYQYDAAHYLRYIVDAAGNYIHYRYDLKGNRTGESIYDNSNVLKRTVTYAHDRRNRVSRITLANDLSQVTDLVHDAVGNLTQETDGNNHTTVHQYDALNRLFRTVNALSQETNYGQDVNDRPTVVTAPNDLSTRYEYDDLGYLLKEISPARGTTRYTYDAAGNVLTVQDARNLTTTYTYDALNRVSQQQSTEAATPRYNYLYDGCFKGRLCSVSRNGAGHLILGYDPLGRLGSQIDLGAGLYSSYGYSPGGRLVSLTYPNHRQVTYDYDFQGAGPKLGHPTAVSTAADDVTTVLARDLRYYPFGPLQGYRFGNGQYFVTDRDRAYRPTFQRSGPRFKWAYYDPAGNLASLLDIGGTTQNFGYSELNELTAASDTQTGSYGDLGYAYRPNGNRERETRDGTPVTYTYSGTRLSYTSDGAYWLYDAAGRVSATGGGGYHSYDGYGRMRSALSGAATYEYNPFHQRTRKTAGGVTTRFHYGPGGELRYETDATGDKAYVFLDDLPLARIDHDSEVYYYHTDPLGTPQALTNEAGGLVWAAHYEPFGRAIITKEAVGNNLRYAGQYFDQETGLHYNWHRYYDPKTGRYISSDPIGLAGGLNTYLYASGNPVRYVDPFGLEVKRCYRYLGNPGKGDTGIYNPLRHDYLVVNDTTYSFQAKGNLLWSQSDLRINDENPNRDSCDVIWEDNKHDKFVEDAIKQFGMPRYGIGPQGTDCQEFSDTVLEKASDAYDKSNPASNIEKLKGFIRDLYWYGR